MFNTVIEETHGESGIFVVVQDCSMKDVAEYLNQLPQLCLPYSRIKLVTIFLIFRKAYASKCTFVPFFLNFCLQVYFERFREFSFEF